MRRVQAAQGVIACAQVEPARPDSHGLRRLHVLSLQFIGVLLDERVGVLREPAGGGEEQAAVAWALRQQALHQLQAERDRILDELGIVVGGKHAAPAGQRISDFVGHHLVD